MPAYQAVSLTKEPSADAAYKAIASDPAFSEILEAIPFRHPVQLYEALAYVSIFVLMYFVFYPKKQWREKPGFLFWILAFCSLCFPIRLGVF
jgi:Prolipoprotein diacylglyceryltransferase